jgi:hypothetical protein
MSDQWYYQQGGVPRGPVTATDLAALARQGAIGPGDFVWREGTAEWTTATAAGFFEDPLASPTPPPILQPAPTHLPAPAMSPSTATARLAAPAPRHNSLAWPIAIVAGGAALVMAGVIGWMANALMNSRDAAPLVASAAVPADEATPQPLPRIVESGPAPEPTRSTKAPPASSREANPALTSAAASPVPATAPATSGVAKPLGTPPAAAATSSPATSSPATSSPASTAAEGSAAQPAPAATASQPEILYQEIDIRRAPKFSILGSVTVQDLEYQMLSELKATPPDAAGSRTVEQYVLETKLLKADELSRPMFAQSLAALRGWHFTYKLIKGGEIAEWKSTPPDGRRTVKVEPPGGAGFLMTSVMDEDGWKEMAKLSFQMPDTTSGSEPWVRQMSHDFGALGSWYGETRFVRKGTSEGLLQVDYTHDMKYTPPEKGKAVADSPLVITAADFKAEVAGGSYFYNAQANRVERLQERFLVRGAIQTELLGQTVEVEVEEDQMITVRIADTNPWK